MTNQPIVMYDIADCAAFVHDCLNRTAIAFSADEREEMVQEGLLILVELSGSYRPRLGGYTQDGRFSGYAARFLPRRLGDAWHRRHPEHRRITGSDGKRRWHYDRPPVSLDLVLQPGSDVIADRRDRKLTREDRLRGINDFVPVAAAA